MGEAELPDPWGGCGACGGLAQATMAAGRGQRCVAVSFGVATRSAVVCGRTTVGGAAWEDASWPRRVVAWWRRWPREDFRVLPGCGGAARDGILLAASFLPEAMTTVSEDVVLPAGGVILEPIPSAQIF